MTLTTLRCLAMAAALAALAHAGSAAEITVSAASSLTNAFQDIAQAYQARHPDARVALNFGASGALLQQIANGAPVDVFACADQETMDQAENKHLLKPGTRQNFAGNALVLIVPADSRLALTSLAQLDQAAVKRVAIGNPASVPVGRYTRRALEAAHLWPQIEAKAISTQNVRQSLDYVARGEVDAGFVYATDAALAKDKVRLAFDVALDQAISYPIALTSAGGHADEAQRFLGFVQSAEGQALLAKYGFRKP